ncbi:GNAT family N-acetyltransferase [Actinosynnema sp. NPDC020468]|uniref:GNAT family N-acetyltransferase n=1 Tax=Actinosynnema sp. NPDC020468 TaxID=3154488 RepID=UPI003409124A
MTDLVTNVPGLVPPTVRDEANRAATAAAEASGVRVSPLTAVPDLAAVCDLYEAIWQPGDGGRLVSVELLRAMVVAGNYVAGAFDGDRLLGACFGFFGEPTKGSLHSHIAGVAREGLGRGLGFALKLHQRAWALDQGVTSISWTFDPLVRRNAHFNLTKLGALPTRYLPNFYGLMRDGINGAGETDRLMVTWRIAEPAVRAAALGEPARTDTAALRERGAVVGLSSTVDGGPVFGRVDGPVVLVAVPPDIEDLRRTHPALGGEWRHALREVLDGLMAEGGSVVGFDRAGWYVVATGPTS